VVKADIINRVIDELALGFFCLSLAVKVLGAAVMHLVDPCPPFVPDKKDQNPSTRARNSIKHTQAGPR
jgi:hypothetical protein